ncbi:MAG: tail protein X [Clostridia bacterium]|nr:tail protein X [Clostridia bacterium]
MTYTTVQGDMWDSIAYKTMGDTAHTDKLILANQKHIGTHIFPSGVVLTIPSITEKLSDSLPPWKRVSG